MFCSHQYKREELDYKLTKADKCFAKGGFPNWKKVLEKKGSFERYECSDAHRKAKY